MKKLDHIDDSGKISMTDVTRKVAVIREAQASGFIHLKPETINLIRENELQKGEVITLAEISGIQAVKNTVHLIPLVHDVQLSHIDVKAYIYPNGIEVKSLVKSVCQRGVEVEALTAVSVALLTIYEVCKSSDASIVISDIKMNTRIQEEV
jgi:cyclic pyranopterin phosphate synthase